MCSEVNVKVTMSRCETGKVGKTRRTSPAFGEGGGGEKLHEKYAPAPRMHLRYPLRRDACALRLKDSRAKSCRTTEPRCRARSLSFLPGSCRRSSPFSELDGTGIPRVRGIYSLVREQRRPPSRRISIAKLINPTSVFPGGHPSPLLLHPETLRIPYTPEANYPLRFLISGGQ